MKEIPLEQPPVNTDPMLAEYLNRMFNNVNLMAIDQYNYDVINIVPVKPKIGCVYYFGAAVGVITAEGWWGYKSTGWVQLA